MASHHPRTFPSQDDRLDSWKEIAAYFKRDVRTVKRWEQNEGLPVHRHTHLKRASIYAYPAELEAWQKNRSPRLAGVHGSSEPKSSPLWRWSSLAAGALGIVIIALLAVASWTEPPQTLNFNERDWVLITDFDNRTGEAVLDGTLEAALTRELSNSRYVNVVPPERVHDVLRLMRRPLDAPLDRELSREVALRDGGIRALVTGQVEKHNSTYVLSADVVDPTTAATVASVSHEAYGEAALVSTTRKIANGVRERLGETLSSIDIANQKLAKVTTPSLRALQLYSQAGAVLGLRVPVGSGTGGDIGAAAESLLRQSIAEDPDFASAHLRLAFALRMQRRAAEKQRAAARRAFDLADTTSERERIMIQASFHWISDRLQEAATAFEKLVQLYPDDYWGIHSLSGVYRELGRDDESVRWAQRLADLRPNDFLANAAAAGNLLMRANDPVTARPYAERAWRSAPEWHDRWAFFLPRTELFPVYEQWLLGGVRRASAEADRIAATLPQRGDFERLMFVEHLFSVYLTLGRFEKAREMLQGRPVAERETRLAAIAAAQGNDLATSEHLQRVVKFVTPGTWGKGNFLLVRSGLDRGIVNPDSPSSPVLDQLVAGNRALGEQRYEDAISLLADGLEGWLKSNSHGVFENFNGLAQARLSVQGVEAAVTVLERASQLRGRAAVVGNGYWIRNQWWLSQLYRELGRNVEAERVEAELLELLAMADSDHSIVHAIRVTQGATQSGRADN